MNFGYMKSVTHINMHNFFDTILEVYKCLIETTN